MYSCGGPSQSKESTHRRGGDRSEPNPDARAHSTVDKHIIGYSHGDRPQMAIAGVHHTCHLMSDQMYEEHNYTAISDSQFASSHRGRKCLSREATRRTELALGWPELVQIGRCKVCWLPSTANKRILTSFYSKKTIYTTLPPPGGSFDPETIS